MPFIALAGWLPQLFWLFLIVICLLIIGVSVYFLLQNKKFHTLFLQTLSSITERLSTLERCRIEHLEDVRSMVRSEDFPLLTAAGEKLASDAERLYQGKWIGDPTPLLTRDRVLTRTQYRSCSGELPIQILSVSVLATSLFLLIGISGTHNRALVTQISFLPALFGAVAALLLFFQAYRARQSIDRGLTHMAETIIEKVPVFRELAGTAALIESFFRYDRQMADAITLLTGTVEQLTHNQLAEKLADNVRVVMEEQVAPPLNAASDALHALAGELAERQESGMRELAERFTANLSQTMDAHLRPFYQEMANLTQDLFEANKQTEIALTTMESYKQQSLDIQNNLTAALEALADARARWKDDIAENSDTLRRLADTTERLTGLQAGSEQNLSQEISLLREKFSQVQDSLYRVTQGLHLENQQTADFVREFNESTQKALGDMSRLTSLLVDQTNHIERQNEILAGNLGNLENGLNQAVKTFSVQLLTGVHDTLDAFDDGLAEVTDRLSNTTAEISDTVNAWASDIRRGEEYRLRVRGEDRAEKEEKNKALLDFLQGKTDITEAMEEAERENPERKDGERLE